MTKKFYYLDMDVPKYFSEIGFEWWQRCLRKRACCPPGCGGVPKSREGHPINIQYTKPPTYSLEPGAMANVLSTPLWSILAPHFPTAIVGKCLLRNPDDSLEEIPHCISMYVPIADRACLRGKDKYSICPSCGSVQCKDIDGKYYFMNNETTNKHAVMLMTRGFAVDELLRNELENLHVKCLGFTSYPVLASPLDGRPPDLNEWAELKRLR